MITYFESGQASQRRQLVGWNLNRASTVNGEQEFYSSVAENGGSWAPLLCSRLLPSLADFRISREAC